MNQRKKSCQRREKDRRSIVLKAKGQVLRISAVIWALDQALCRFNNDTDDEMEWSDEISVTHLNVAIETCHSTTTITTQAICLII